MVQELKYIEQELRAFILSLPESATPAEVARFFGMKTGYHVNARQVEQVRRDILGHA